MVSYKERRRCRRPARTCRECHQRKVKCSRTQPCANCAAWHRECVYVPSPTTADRLSRLEATTVSFRSEPALNDTPAPSNFPNPGNDDLGSQISSIQSRPSSETLVLNGRMENLERVFTSRALDYAGGREIYSSQPMLRDGRAALNKSRIFGRSHWLNTAYQFSEMQDLFHHDSNEASPELEFLKSDIERLFRQCKSSARILKSFRAGRDFPHASTTILTAPPRHLAEEMGRLYFARFESAFRILHIPSYWREFNRYYDDCSRPLTTLLKIRLVTTIGLGLQAEYGKSREARSTASQGIMLSQSWVSGLLEKDRLSIDGIQIQCLLMIARQTLAFGADLIWISVGTLQRTAMQMGLHRDPIHFPDMSLLMAETRRRLWATIIELSLQSSLDSGMPPMISLNDYDTACPTELDDVEIDEGSTPHKPRSTSMITDASLQVILFKAVPIRLQILCSVNGLQTETFYDDVLRMSAHLNDFGDQCLAVAQLGKDEGHRFKSNLAELLLKRFALILHAPFAVRARKNRAFQVSLDAYLSSALAILSANLDPTTLHLLVVGGGLFKTLVINAALIASHQAIAVAEHERQFDKSCEVQSGLKVTLGTALGAALSLAEKRLCSGETNVRLYCTIHMALGHIAALCSGEALPLAIAKHAKMALEKAIVILRAQHSPDDAATTEPLTDPMLTLDGSPAAFCPHAYPFGFTSTYETMYDTNSESPFWYG